jgi:hypothetical protein
VCPRRRTTREEGPDGLSRYAYVEQHPTQHGATSAAFLRRAVAHFAALGLAAPQAVMTDNAFPYTDSRRFKAELSRIGARTSARPPTRLAGTARLNASSRRSSASGPTPTRGPTQQHGRAPCHPVCATATDDVHTAPWETTLPSGAFTTSVGRTARARLRPSLAPHRARGEATVSNTALRRRLVATDLRPKRAPGDRPPASRAGGAQALLGDRVTRRFSEASWA